MSTSSASPGERLRQQIEASLARARQQRAKTQRRTNLVMLSQVGLSAASTLIAGVATILGQAIMNDWRLTCGVAAAFALGATLVGTLQQQLGNVELLAEINETIGKLRALLLETLANDYDTRRVEHEYGQLLKDHERVAL